MEERDRIEERSNRQPPGPQDSGARQRDSWPMGYLTEGRRSNSRMKILLMSLPAAMHQVILSALKISRIFPLNGNFLIHLCVCLK